MCNLPYLDKPSRWSSHSRIVACLNALPAHSKVLDVGTASGMLARMCQDETLRFFGVEANAEWAQIAAPFYEKIWICPFEDVSNEYLIKYDAIVLGDVLEHMPAPEVALKRLAELQTSGCLFIISLPNVANLWVRLNLLLGRFDYTERGILDRTHLRFFTRKTIVAMIKSVGLEIVSIQVTPIPLELVSVFFTTTLGRGIHAAVAWLTFLLPTLLGYQFIVESRKP